MVLVKFGPNKVLEIVSSFFPSLRRGVVIESNNTGVQIYMVSRSRISVELTNNQLSYSHILESDNNLSLYCKFYPILLFKSWVNNWSGQEMENSFIRRLCPFCIVPNIESENHFCLKVPISSQLKITLLQKHYCEYPTLDKISALFHSKGVILRNSF